MNKKEYIQPLIKIVYIGSSDIICTSYPSRTSLDYGDPEEDDMPTVKGGFIWGE